MSSTTIFMSDSLKGRVPASQLSDNIAPSEILCRFQIMGRILDFLPQKIISSPGIISISFLCDANQALVMLGNRSSVTLDVLHNASDEPVLSFKNVNVLETRFEAQGLDSYHVELTVTTKNSA